MTALLEPSLFQSVCCLLFFLQFVFPVAQLNHVFFFYYLRIIWKTSAGWKMVPLSRGYYDFHFDSVDDLRKIWAAGTVNLKPGLLRLSQWTKDFKYLA